MNLSLNDAGKRKKSNNSSTFSFVGQLLDLEQTLEFSSHVTAVHPQCGRPTLEPAKSSFYSILQVRSQG
ncbi:hypothetical protein A6R68_19451 [Neotoma lepida]|uniref:Uncharacterized protein n=1 Tax=Neotoma lepida TaxID=56216 RepID=A0A1A6HHW6_NEOLE|nr:hypothetical protein A6R68_19451 [Neotoma lepida]